MTAKGLALVALAVLLVAAAGVAGAAAGGPAGAAGSATVTGTVTAENGSAVADAYVLLEPADGDLLGDATDGDQAVVESLLKLAETDPDGVHVVRTGADGRYEVTVPAGEHRVVAVAGRAVSQTVTVAGNGTADLVVDEERVLSVEAAAPRTAAPGERATASLRVANVDDDPVEGLVVTLGAVPEGWSLTGVETAGSYDPADRTVTVDRLGPDEAVEVTVSLSVADDAERGRYRMPVAADSDTHYLEHEALAVRVRPENATPTPTGIGGQDTATPTPLQGGTTRPTTWPPERTESSPPTGVPLTDTPMPTGTGAPGFGAALAVAALLVAAARRWHSAA